MTKISSIIVGVLSFIVLATRVAAKGGNDEGHDGGKNEHHGSSDDDGGAFELERQDFEALFWGICSAISFPMGAALGIMFDIPEKIIVALMSFGAGALIFALSIELFGRAMQEMEEGKIGKAEVFCSMFTAILGALSFILMNRVLGGHEGHDDGEHGTHIPLEEIGGEEDSDSDEESDEEQQSSEYAKIKPAKETTALAGSLSLDDAVVVQQKPRKTRSNSTGGDDGATPPVTFRGGTPVVTPVGTPREVDSDQQLSRRSSSMTHLNPKKKKITRSKTLAHIGKNRSGSDVGLVNQQGVSGLRRVATLADNSRRPLARMARQLLPQPPERPDDWVPSDDGSPRDRSDSLDSDLAQAPPGAGGAAMAIWLGLTMDGVPEAMVIGILANGEVMSMALVAGVFLANFPEAIATAAMMNKSGMSWIKNMALWTSLCLMTGMVAMLSAFVFPRKNAHWIDFVTTSSEGLAAGAMLAMIAGTMLPDAYKQGGADLVGFMTVVGFVAVLLVKVLFPAMPEAPEHPGHD